MGIEFTSLLSCNGQQKRYILHVTAFTYVSLLSWHNCVFKYAWVFRQNASFPIYLLVKMIFLRRSHLSQIVISIFCHA